MNWALILRKGITFGVQINEEILIYFVVNNDGRNNYDNGKTLFGRKNLYREVLCSSVDKSEFMA